MIGENRPARAGSGPCKVGFVHNSGARLPLNASKTASSSLPLTLVSVALGFWRLEGLFVSRIFQRV